MEKLYPSNLVKEYFSNLIITTSSHRQDIISKTDYFIYKHDQFIPVVKRKNIQNRYYYESMMKFIHHHINLQMLIFKYNGNLHQIKYFNIDKLINNFRNEYYYELQKNLISFFRHIEYNDLNDWKIMLKDFSYDCLITAPNNFDIQKIAIDISLDFMEFIINPSDEIINYALSKCTKRQKLTISKYIKPPHYEKKNYLDEEFNEQCYLSTKMANRLLYSTKFALKYILKYYNYENEFIEIIMRDHVKFATQSEILDMVS